MTFFNKKLSAWRRGASKTRLLCILFLLAPGAQASASNFALQGTQFRQIAAELLSGLQNAKLGEVTASSGYEVPKVALRDFDEDPAILPANEARALNRHLLTDLQTQGGEHFHFVDRANMAALTEEADLYNTAADRQRQAENLRENSRADILIIGNLRKTGTAIYLSYQGIAVDTGQILVSTKPRSLLYSTPISVNTAAVPFSLQEIEASTVTAPYRATVEQAEIRLEELGYEPGIVDGRLTNDTRTALREYQADSALEVTGRLTRKTFRNMFLDTRAQLEFEE